MSLADNLPTQVRKRDGILVPFDAKKIKRAVFRAACEVLEDSKQASSVADAMQVSILQAVSSLFGDRIPSVENIQDIVENTLMEAGYGSIAKSYILYRKEHQDLRQAKVICGVRDDLKLPLNTLLILKKRYLLRDDDQKIIESPRQLFRRVAKAVSAGEENFRTRISRDDVEERFDRMMTELEFMPNSPTLMNAGTKLGQLSACFVLPVEDSMDGIFESLGNMAKIHQTGGGTGFDFSRLRPKNDLVSTTKGSASGPVSFMSIFNQATGVIVQGGKRRGANMGILRCDHPDIFDFIEAKQEERAFDNFNLSVAVTDIFLEAVRTNEFFSLFNPRTAKEDRKIKARALYDLIVYSAWRTGDPGLVFIDEINRHNPTPALGRIEATNPCGEVPLLPYESCNLASINLSRFVTSRHLDWERLKETVHWGVRFLDDVIEVNAYPLPQIAEMTRGNRKIGLGVMGFADMLIKLGMSYLNPEAEALASKLMQFVRQESLAASQSLAEERGVFPNYEKSVHAREGLRLRNAALNTIAPTGTVSIIAGCSSGIEPLFALSYVRNVLSGSRLFETHPLFEEGMRRKGLDTKELMAEVGRQGSIQNIREIPDVLKRIFVTSFDVPPEVHLRIQAVFQQHTDNSVSKTINLPGDATVEDVRDIFNAAHRLKCKGITVYRYGTKKDQVLTFDTRTEEERGVETDFITAGSEYSGGCVTGLCPF